jgi:hypothetical protein
MVSTKILPFTTALDPRPGDVRLIIHIHEPCLSHTEPPQKDASVLTEDYNRSSDKYAETEGNVVIGVWTGLLFGLNKHAEGHGAANDQKAPWNFA